MKGNEKWMPALLMIAAFITVASSIFIASQRDLSSLENTLLQVFSLCIGLIGSFMFGKQSAKDGARELIKPHARSAFRRLMSLYESLSRVLNEIERYRDQGPHSSESHTIAKLEAIVIEQLSTADDALEDWNDIVPDEVSELRNKLENSRSNGKNDE